MLHLPVRTSTARATECDADAVMAISQEGSTLYDYVADNLRTVTERIEAVHQAGPFASNDIPTLVAASKGHPVEAIHAAMDAGHSTFGESRVQEAETKWGQIVEADSSIELHMIGQVQRKKVGAAVRLFHVVQTLDRIELADAFARALENNPDARLKEMFVQVNMTDNPDRGGVQPSDADGLIRYCLRIGLPVTGVMCMAPGGDVPSTTSFELLRAIAERNELPNRSMGMSGDFEAAIHLGATHVRIGTAIFGERQYT